MATALLAYIALSDFRPSIQRGLTAGFDAWYWSPTTADGRLIVEILEGQRDAAIAAKAGGTFADLEAAGRAGEYLDAMETVPSVQDWLNQRLGHPLELFGSVPGWLGDASAAQAKWQAICAAVPVEQAA